MNRLTLESTSEDIVQMKGSEAQIKFSWAELWPCVLGSLAGIILWLLLRSIRWQIKDPGNLQIQNQRIYAFWHNQQLMLPAIYRQAKLAQLGRRLQVLISRHRDGRIIAHAVKIFGMSSIAGSSSRGGVEALKGLIGAVRCGNDAAITPDGPRGPLYRVKPGIILLAQKSGAAICPIACGVNATWRVHSWDKLIVPRPFAKGVAYTGAPIFVPAELSSEEFNARLVALESSLMELTQKVEAHDYR